MSSSSLSSTSYNKLPDHHLLSPSSSSSSQQQQQQASISEQHYREAYGNGITLYETRHTSVNNDSGDGAVEYVLKDQSRRAFSAVDLGLLCLALVIFSATLSPVYVALGIVLLAALFRTTSDRTNSLLLVESVGVHIINKKTIFGTLEEYLPWDTISDVFINEVISEQKVLYFLTFIVKEFTCNGDERIRLIPLFRDLKPERKCLEYINAVPFSYSKELMKIIRKIIKWQPRKGQHFSTKNLLVTYNRATWSRQDKIFTVMKFCDRPDAKAFPHTIILTLKLLSQQESQGSEETMGGSATKPIVENSSVSNSLAENILPKASESNDLLRQDESVDVVTSNGHQEGEESNDSTSRSPGTLSPSNDSSDVNDPAASPIRLTAEEEGEEETSNSRMNDVDPDSSSANSNLEDAGVNESTNEPSTSPPGLKSDESAGEDSDDSNSSSPSDSTSLPYQYLIERDIERELQHSTLARENIEEGSKENDAKSANTALQPCDSFFVHATSNDSKSSIDSQKSNRFKPRLESRDSILATPDIINLKSSNITDLVMKGRMFTIKQDKDTVVVVEQKTKLEVDEVLENSEKVETKAGDPCLLNSSLLRLEKMVTRIQEPLSLPEHRHNDSSENSLISFINLTDGGDKETAEKRPSDAIATEKEISESTKARETSNSWSGFFPNKEVSDSTFEKIEKVLGDSSLHINNESSDDDLELKIDDDEEEDFAPEPFHNKFFDGIFDTSKISCSDSFQDFLMNDIDSSKKVSDKEGASSETENEFHSIPILNEPSLIKNSKLPKVISNQTITNDQIPTALLKSLKTKSKCQENGEISNSSNMQDIIKNNNDIDQNIDQDKLQNEEESVVTEEKIETTYVTVNENSENSIENNVKVVPEKVEEIGSEDYTDSFKSSSLTSNTNSIVSSKITSKEESESHSNNSNKKKKDETPNLENVRRTRLNSKLYTTSSELSNSIISNENTNGHPIKTRSQKVLQKNFLRQENADLNHDKVIHKKRRISAGEEVVTKFYKTAIKNESKEVTIQTKKLFSDLIYGVKVVVNRIKVANTPR